MMNGLKNLLEQRFSLLFILLLFGACPTKKKTVEKPVYIESATTIKKGKNLEEALNTITSNSELTQSIINTLKSIGFSFGKCLPGDSIKIIRKDNEFFKFIYRQSPTVVYYIINQNPHLVGAMKFCYIDTTRCFLKAEITSSLYETILSLGEMPELVFRYADIFAWEIDFATDTQNGDSLYIYFKKFYCDSNFISYADVIFVRYKGMVGDYYGIYYNDPEDYNDYYNLKGESLRKSLLKSPLRYSFISSYFSKSRFHPILKIWRPHHGLDYSAPVGAPVSSIGDGVVIYKGWRGSYGNLVEIRHKNNFKSRYGHLSLFAKGLYTNKRVKMGDLIGYVGSTGLSTGPHLHFELYKDGVAINPIKVKIPRAPSVKQKYYQQFKHHCDSLLTIIEGLSKNEQKILSKK